MKELLQFLETSYTAFHAVEHARALLESNGFIRLDEGEQWKIAEGGKYFAVRDGNSLIAFTVGKKRKFQIVASHTDSPCLKLKDNPVMTAEGYKKLNAETYGGGIWYSFFDRPLKIAGRVAVGCENGVKKQLFTSDYNVIIPSVAIHQNREANAGFAPNAQTDLLPLFSIEKEELALPEHTLAYDLFITCAEVPFVNGANGELISSPRVDNLTSVYSSLTALIAAKPAGINVCACFDNEEVGSRTLQGAGSDFLSAALKRISAALGMDGEEYLRALASSFLISLDNAHALHPNHPEKCDPTNRPALGGGITIKYHADKAYTTDALTSAVLQTVFEKAGAKYQKFYNRSDMRSGSTLGAISLSQLGIPSCDIGLAQLAMHSAVETFAKSDYAEMVKGLKAFYDSEIHWNADGVSIK